MADYKKYKIKIVYKRFFMTRVVELENIPRDVTKVVDGLCTGDVLHLAHGNNKHFYVNTNNIVYMTWE